jgi:hypothetical protein
MPWTQNDAESHTHKATTPELKELWAKVANESLERNVTRAAPSAKQTLWSGRHNPASSQLSAFNGHGLRAPSGSHG